MTATMINVNSDYGSFTESATGYTANLTELGSSAVESVSLCDDTLTVVFRHSHDSTAYTYNATPEAKETLYKELVNVLSDREGSLGVVINQLIRQNKIQLI
jgi:hypothetical protein